MIFSNVNTYMHVLVRVDILRGAHMINSMKGRPFFCNRTVIKNRRFNGPINAHCRRTVI